MNPQSHDVRLRKCQVPTRARFSYLISPFVFLWVWPATCVQIEGICVFIVLFLWAHIEILKCVCVCYLLWCRFGDMRFALWLGSGELSRLDFSLLPHLAAGLFRVWTPRMCRSTPLPLLLHTAWCLKANTPFLFHPIEGSLVLLAWTQWLTGHVANGWKCPMAAGNSIVMHTPTNRMAWNGEGKWWL